MHSASNHNQPVDEDWLNDFAWRVHKLFDRFDAWPYVSEMIQQFAVAADDEFTEDKGREPVGEPPTFPGERPPPFLHYSPPLLVRGEPSLFTKYAVVSAIHDYCHEGLQQRLITEPILADPWADDPVKNWRAAHAYTILKFNRVPEFLEKNSETLESFLVEVTADLESRFGNPELAPWPVEERVVSKADGDTAEANQDQADLDGVAAEEAVLLDAAGEPLIDPITIDQAAVLLWLDVKTIRNKGKKGRPNAAIPASGNKSARYRYREFRPWLAAKFPKEADRLPESYEEAKNIFSVVVSDSDDD